MSNMGYCRFQNTLSDLSDCLEGVREALSGEELSNEETRAAVRLVMLCGKIVNEVADCGDDDLGKGIVDGTPEARIAVRRIFGEIAESA